MAVVDGQKVNAEVTNAAYLSRTDNSDTVGRIDLKDDASIVSGPFITNIQRELNFARKVRTSPLIAADGQITSQDFIGTQIFSIKSTGGAVNMSATVPIITTSPVIGQEIIIIGLSNTDTVRLTNVDAVDGVLLNGEITFKLGTLLRLIYEGNVQRWIEAGRTDI